MVKQNLVCLIDEAVVDGARVKPACEVAEISYRSYLRWKSGTLVDRRKGAAKRVVRRLAEDERQRLYELANSEPYRDQTPGQIIADLLEKGIYIGSERTLYRILKEHRALSHRRETRKPTTYRKPPQLTATGPNQVWTWDITWLKTPIKGMFVYVYVIIDIFSRAIVGWSIEPAESPEAAKDLFDRVIRDRKVTPHFVHADNGGPMKGLTLVAFLTGLNVNLSFSRPRVSDDNPFIESFFATLKTNVRFPGVFSTVEHARTWFASFVDWYNTSHRHSGIGYVTPSQKHTGEDIALFQARQDILNQAARLHPERFVQGPRTIMPRRTVVLNRAA